MSNLKRGLVTGIVGGFLATIAMTVTMVGIFSLLGLSFEAFAGAVPIDPALFGVLHFSTGSGIGLIFGVAVIKVERFQIQSLGKASVLGLVAGITAFVLLYLPLTVFAIAPAVSLSIVSMILTGSVLAHLVFGAVLGVIVGFRLRGSAKSSVISSS